MHKGSFKVKSLALDHTNHEPNEKVYNLYLENLRLTETEKQIAAQMLKCGACKQKMKNYLMENREGKPVSLKSLHNLQQQTNTPLVKSDDE